MSPLSSAHVSVIQPVRARDRGAWRWCVGAGLTVVLAACGGGGEVAGGGAEMPMAASFEQSAAQMPEAAKKTEPSPTLAAQPISMVNTTTAGDQALRAIGALSDGGYTVAWLSGTTLYIQRYDSAGNKSGTETAVLLVRDPRDWPTQPASSSVAVLSDGSVVVAYATIRSTEEPRSPIVTETGVYMQRFDQNGVQTLPETQLVSIVGGDPRRPITFGGVQVLPMPDGAYVVGWMTLNTSPTVGPQFAFSTRRFDGRNQPVGEILNVRPPGGTILQYRLVADGNGGYTAYWSGTGSDFLPTGLMVTHYDANHSATNILAAWPGTALLLPLEDGRYVLYTSDTGGVYRQFLDSAGAPVGERTSDSSMPISAQLLADGSHVVFWTAAEGTTAQRFDANGASIGDLLTIQATGTQPVVVALAEGGFAAAWSAMGANADLDVYTQRFIETLDNQRRACLASTKGLRGQERKAANMACLR